MDNVIIFGMIVFYKICSIFIGLAFAYMGYRLFLLDKNNDAGSLEAEHRGFQLKLTRAAPGTFFSLFGTILIVFSVLKGIAYSSDGRAGMAVGSDVPASHTPSGEVQRILPNKPPF